MKNNKKGFTLVELLAVIVILAVVILIAVTAVIPRMNKAKRNAFVDEANAYAKAGVEAYVASTMENATSTCFTVKWLNENYIDKKDTGYDGWVQVSVDSSTDVATATVYITNGKYALNNLSGSDIKLANVVDATTVTGTRPTTCTKLSSES